MAEKVVKITVNGQVIDAVEGKPVLKSALDAGIKIPHFCYHPGLSVAGACRMCIIEIEGVPRPQISCNTPVKEGMVVRTDTPQVKNSVKWALELHLINHPIDCPICDQAGECALQDYYMKHGKYRSRMEKEKVHKEKVVNLGKVFLDQERCILCSRCVRFCDEVAKSPELKIFNRGDSCVLSTFEKQPLQNNYTQNVVDICPVGALTSTDFRFQSRVWFLKEFPSICPGCSTGCNTRVSYHENKLFRITPRFNPDINQYWLCDFGRETYKFCNPDRRVHSPRWTGVGGDVRLGWNELLDNVKRALPQLKGEEGAVMITPQVTTEEAFSCYDFFSKSVGAQLYHWIDEKKMNRAEASDGILIRDDKNPNSKGLWEVARSFNMEKNNLLAFNQRIEKGVQWIVVVAPENFSVYPEWKSWAQKLSAIPVRILVASADDESSIHFSSILPTVSYVEKHGTFVNSFGRIQEIYPAPLKIIEEAKPLAEIVNLFAANWGFPYAVSEGDLEGAVLRLPLYKDFQYQSRPLMKKIGRRRIYESYD